MKDKRELRVAYVTTYDARVPANWSGTGYFMWKALQGDGIEVDLMGPLADSLSRLWEAKTRLYRGVLGRQYERERQPWLQRHYARQVHDRLAAGHYDAIVSPGTIPIARLRTRIPTVFWTDSTFAGMVDFYPAFTGLASETIRRGNEGEQTALDRCSLAIYASEWAAGTARDRYRVDESKLRVVPLGANLEHDPAPDQVAASINRRPIDECRLLFVGVDWHRKGGDVAVAVTGELIRRGIAATLTVVGVRPPADSPAFVEYAGYIDKGRPDDAARYDALLAGSHFLIVPSRAEAYGLVYAEASAFGVPSLATRVGGVSTVVSDGVNGFLFEPGAPPWRFADIVASHHAAPDRYRSLAHQAAEEYRRRLNWAVAGQSVRTLLLGLSRPG